MAFSSCYSNILLLAGISVLVTAFGVGELSAINAVAGAYAERSPVVHIVGMPPMSAQKARACLHHSLGDGNFRTFANMYSSISTAHIILSDASRAPVAINQVLRDCIAESRPVYMELPSDMVSTRIARDSLAQQIPRNKFPTHEFSLNEVALIADRLLTAQQPVIIVDGGYIPGGISGEAKKLVRTLGCPTLTTPAGKGIINETESNFYGVYNGIAADEGVRQFVESCDLVLWIAPLLSDVNTCGFTSCTDPKANITFHENSVEIGEIDGIRRLDTVCVKALLLSLDSYLLDVTNSTRLSPTPRKLRRLTTYPGLNRAMDSLKALPPVKSEACVDQSTFWLRMSRFLRSGDIILTECGTSSFGGRELILPPDTTLVNSTLWLSIGVMLPAAQGAAAALKELKADGQRVNGRTILFIGDGSLQMTIQSISDIIRNRLNLIIFVINNKGYTMERFIHGTKADYNDIQPWSYLEAPRFFGAPEGDPDYPVITQRACTWGEMQSVLDSESIAAGMGLTMVEVVMDKEDAPTTMKKLMGKAAEQVRPAL